MPPDLEELRTFAVETVRLGGRETLKWFRKDVSVDDKSVTGPVDPVTEADRACERAIRNCIQERWPNHAIVGEEFADHGTGEWQWIIDPVDGTRAFISGFAHWGVLLGLLHQGEPVLGVLGQPFTQEIFVGDNRTAQWLRHDHTLELRTRGTNSVREASLATTDPRLFTRVEDQRAYLRVEENVRLVRYGNDCYQYAMLAHGLVDLVIENNLSPWDIQPVIPIVRGAGGVVSNWHGGDDLSSGHAIAAANNTLLEQAVALLQGTTSS